MNDYLLGVLTIPALLMLGSAVFAGWIVGTEALARRGITFEMKGRGRVGDISDYIIRNNIWWERPFGPVFVGGWYREQPQIDGSYRAVVNRWFGIGGVNGPCFVIFRSRDLGDVDNDAI